jgi:hypothetical protein
VVTENGDVQHYPPILPEGIIEVGIQVARRIERVNQRSSHDYR